VPWELVDTETAIGSSDAPMQQKSQHRKVQVRLFDPPKVPLESIDEHDDFDQHDTSEHYEPKLGTSHESREEHTIDGKEAILHGAEWIKSTRSLDLTFLLDDACVMIKIKKIASIC
jgi:hypothetical protein